MDAITTLYGLQEKTDDAEIYSACEEAIQSILHEREMKTKLEHSVTLPCKLGDTVYSIIGERIHVHVINEFRIEQEETYAVADGIYFKESQLGMYWFLNESVAENAFRLWNNGKLQKNRG